MSGCGAGLSERRAVVSSEVAVVVRVRVFRLRRLVPRNREMDGRKAKSRTDRLIWLSYLISPCPKTTLATP